jgi:hypothetical protein
LADLHISPIPLFFEHQQSADFAGSNVVERDSDPQLQRCPEIERPSQSEPGLGILGSAELVERAVITAAAVFGCIPTEGSLAFCLFPGDSGSSSLLVPRRPEHPHSVNSSPPS